MTASLHSKYFQVCGQFLQFGCFLYSNIEEQATLSIFILTEYLQTFKSSWLTQGNLIAMYSLELLFSFSTKNKTISV